MMVPLMLLQDQGYTFTLATPKGNVPFLDPMSDRTIWFGFSNAGTLVDSIRAASDVLSSLWGLVAVTLLT